MPPVRTGMKRPSGATPAAAVPTEHMRTPKRGTGHVFVLNCELEGLAADAILVPGGNGSGVVLRDGSQKTRVYEIGLPSEADQGTARPLFEMMQRFLQMAGGALSGSKSAYGRSKPLLGVTIPKGLLLGPFISEMSGGIDEGHCLMAPLYDEVERFGIDAAVCVPDKRLYCIVQSFREKVRGVQSVRGMQSVAWGAVGASCPVIPPAGVVCAAGWSSTHPAPPFPVHRTLLWPLPSPSRIPRQVCPFSDGPFWQLPAGHMAMASRLHLSAMAKRLTLFVGAGVSLASGLPSWAG